MKSSSWTDMVVALRDVSRVRPAVQEAWPWILPSIVFTLHSLLFFDWIIDDAGISFAYARNFADGNGLVSQPGVPPVEGYSNFLWVVLLAPFFALGLFDPLYTPKVLGIALTILSFFYLYQIFVRQQVTQGKAVKDHRFAICLTLLLLSMNTAFVVWTTSGLENPLYLLLASLLLGACMNALNLPVSTKRQAVSIGLLAGAIALTRPEGMIFALAFPLLLLIAFATKRVSVSFSNVIAQTSVYTIAFVAIYGAYILFRLVYFDDLQLRENRPIGGRHRRNADAREILAPQDIFTGFEHREYLCSAANDCIANCRDLFLSPKTS